MGNGKRQWRGKVLTDGKRISSPGRFEGINALSCLRESYCLEPATSGFQTPFYGYSPLMQPQILSASKSNGIISNKAGSHAEIQLT